MLKLHLKTKTMPLVLVLGLTIGLGACESAAPTSAPTTPSVEAPTPPPPPPPPRPAPDSSPLGASDMAMSGASEAYSRGGAMVVTGAFRERLSKAAIPEVDEKIIPPQVLPQSGQLTAGVYDDARNPELFQSYLDEAKDIDPNELLPIVDASSRITINFASPSGVPARQKTVTLVSADGQTLFPLETDSAGAVHFFPQYDGLEAGMIVRYGRGNSATDLKLTKEILAGQRRSLRLSVPVQPSAQVLDFHVVLDATGSMKDEMRFLQAELLSILERVSTRFDDLDMRIGYTVYRDDGDDYVTKTMPLSRDMGGLLDKLSDETARGGGDFPEAMDKAMQDALVQDWRDDAVKITLLVADAPPHMEDISDTWDTALLMRTKGVHTVTLAASGVDETAEYMMRAMSHLTGGRYIFLTDDSGIGNAHAEPKIDCYVVTRLDHAVQRTIESLVSGENVEPNEAQIIRSVGPYDNGRCRIQRSDKQ